ncbi:MAG: hypothetical protein KDB60_11360 [Propionibacteriaceae bacterium]|nr:hypothetical protein [Propionibacteriaceae bacterium]
MAAGAAGRSTRLRAPDHGQHRPGPAPCPAVQRACGGPARAGRRGRHRGRDEQQRLGPLLAALPAQQRRVVVLRYLHDLSEADVAAELGLPLGTVKSNASRGLAALRTALTGTTEGSGR